MTSMDDILRKRREQMQRTREELQKTGQRLQNLRESTKRLQPISIPRDDVTDPKRGRISPPSGQPRIRPSGSGMMRAVPAHLAAGPDEDTLSNRVREHLDRMRELNEESRQLNDEITGAFRPLPKRKP